MLIKGAPGHRDHGSIIKLKYFIIELSYCKGHKKDNKKFWSHIYCIKIWWQCCTQYNPWPSKLRSIDESENPIQNPSIPLRFCDFVSVKQDQLYIHHATHMYSYQCKTALINIKDLLSFVPLRFECLQTCLQEVSLTVWQSCWLLRGLHCGWQVALDWGHLLVLVTTRVKLDDRSPWTGNICLSWSQQGES